jgi:pimeloyl-ACP methyl ester carboxylesterase
MSTADQYPDRVSQDAVRDYLTGSATIERARDLERVVASLDAADRGRRRPAAHPHVPTLLVWGTADANFPVKWAYHLRDLIPGRADQVSDGPPGALAMNVSVQ